MLHKHGKKTGNHGKGFGQHQEKRIKSLREKPRITGKKF